MNKIYRVVWNKETNTWTAVCEYAKSKGKSSSSSGVVGTLSNGVFTAVRFTYTALVSALILVSGQAMAATINDGTAAGAIVVHTGNTSQSAAAGQDSTAIGTNAKVIGATDTAQSSIAFGSNATVTNAKNAIAFGTGASSDKNNAVSIGNVARATGQSALAVGDGANATNGQDTAVGVNTVASGNGSSAFGYLTKATGYLSTAVGNQAQAKGGSSIAVGKSEAATENSIAVGNGAAANTRSGTIAIGADTTASGTSSVALGTNSKSTAQSTVAVGSSAKALKDNAVAIGDQAEATSSGTIALGQAAGRLKDTTLPNTPPKNRTGNNGVFIGVKAGDQSDNNENQVAIGHEAAMGSTGNHNLASGYKAGQYINGANNIAIGHAAGKGIAPTTGTDAQPAQIVNLNNTVAIGHQATTNTNNTVVIGNTAKVSGTTPIDTTSSVMSGISGIAIGNGSEVRNRNFGIAIGDGAFVGTYNQTKAATGAEGYNASRGDQSDNAGRPGVAIGWKTQSTGDDSIALGNDSISTGRSSVSLGKAAYAEDTDAIAIGNSARAGQAKDSSPINRHNSTAIGSYAQAIGGWNTALGTRAYANNDRALAVGSLASAEGQNATAVGSYSFVEGDGGSALGYHAIVTKKAGSGTALGVGTVVDGKRSGGLSAVANSNPATVDNTNRSYIGGEDNYAIGNKNIVGGQTKNSVALGNNIKLGATSATLNSTNPVGVGNSIAPREETVTYTNEKALENAIAIGNNANVTDNNGIAVGTKAKAQVEDSIAIGRGTTTELLAGDTEGNREGMIAIGSNTTKASGKAAISIGRNAQGIGRGTVALGDASQANSGQGIAIGAQASVAENSAGGIAVGSLAKSSQATAVAIGTLSSASASHAVALGRDSEANRTALTNVTTSNAAKANTNQVYALGHASDTDKQAVGATVKGNLGAVSVGTEARTGLGNTQIAAATRQIINVAAGSEDSDAVNVAQLKAVANQLTHYYSVKTTDTTATSNYNNDGAKGLDSLAAGVRVEASRKNGVAIGSDVIAAGSESLAIGNNVKAAALDDSDNVIAGTDIKGATAIGNNSRATAEGAQAFGQSSKATAENAAAVGRLATASGARASAFGVGNTASGESSFSGGDRTVAAGKGAIAIGTWGNEADPRGNKSSRADAPYSVVVGAAAEANQHSDSAVVIGNQASAVGASANSTAKDSVAIGYRSAVTAASTIAVGSNAKANGKSQAIAVGFNSEAIGYQATAIGSGARVGDNGAGVALGQGASVTANFGTALGRGSSVTAVEGVALGSQSKATIAANQVGADPLGAVAGNTSNSTWTSTHGAVSVGDGTTITRQITSVAAGTQDTDAVNVAQLKTVANHTKNVGNTIVNVLGGDAAITPEGNITMGGDQDGIGGTGKTNIDDAIKAATTKVTSNDKSVTVTHDAVSNTYDLAVNTDDTTIVKDQTTGALKANTAPITVVAAGQPNAGSASVASGDEGKLATAGDIANAINNSGFTLTAQGESSTASLVNPGEKVDLSSGDGNLVISKDAASNNVNFNLAPVVTIGPNSGGSPITINGTAGNISGLAANLPVTTSTGTPTTAQLAPANPAIGNAATVGDVLNAGWNVQTNGDATDFVRAYDTVNFADGVGTTITSKTDGNKTTFKVNVNAQGLAESAQLPVVYTDGFGNKVYKHTDGKFYDEPNGQGDQIAPGDIVATMQAADGSVVKPTSLTNVAAGANDTDAVNVSQLKGAVTALGGGAQVNLDGSFKAPTYTLTDGNPSLGDTTTYHNVGDALAGLNTAVNQSLSFSGDAGDAFDRKLGSAIKLTGGVTESTKLTDNNIGVVAKDGILDIKLAKDIDLGNDGSVTTGGVQVNNEGLTIIDGPSITKSNGINAGNKVIADVASNLPTTQNNTAIQGSPSNATKAQEAPTNADIIKNNAATVGDVLNAGWNVQTNGDATDFVRAYDTVNFADGVGTTITSKTDGNKTTFKVNVNAQGLAESAQLPVVYTNANGEKVYKVNGKFTTDPTGQDLSKVVDNANVIASMQNADGTITPTKLTNVNDGEVSASSKDAVNGSQLFATNQNVTNNANAITGLQNQTFKLQANGDVATAVKASDTVQFLDGDNIAITRNTNDITIATKKDVKFDSVIASGTKLDNGGLTFVDGNGGVVANSPSITKTGISAGNNKITNVDAGTDDSDAVNVGQLKAVNAKAGVKTKVTQGNGVTVTNKGTAEAPSYEVALSEKTKDSLGKADSALQTVKSIDKNLLVTKNGSAITLDFKDDPTFGKVTTGTGANQVILDDTGVKVGGNTYISGTGLNANNKKVTNVANGTITADSKDAINGSQLYAVSTATKNLMGGNATVNADGTVTASNIGGTNANTIDDAIKTVKTTVKSTDNSIKVTANPADTTNGTVFDISVNAQGLAESAQLPVVYTKKDGTKVYKVGDKFFDNKAGTGTEVPAADIIASMQNADGTTATPTTLANVANGDVTSTSKDAVNGSQLFAQGEGVKNIIGGNTTYDPSNGTYKNADIGGTGKATIDEAIKASKTEVAEGKNVTVTTKTGTNGQTIYTVATKDDVSFNKVTTGTGTNQVVLDDTGVKVGGNTYISGTGLNANNKKVTNVADGAITATSKDAVNGGQLRNTAGDIATIIGSDASVDDAGNVTVSNIGGTGQNNIHDAIQAVNANAAKAKTTVSAGSNIVVMPNTNTDGSTNYTVATAKDLTVDSVKAGDTTINNGGVTIANANPAKSVSLTANGLNNGGNKITNVAKGESDTDAVNVSQLNELKKIVTGGNVNTNVTTQQADTGNAPAGTIITVVNNPDGSTTTTTEMNQTVVVSKDKGGKDYYLTTYNVEGQNTYVTNDVIQAIGKMNEQGIKFFHTNDGEVKPVIQGSNNVDSSASGSYATAIGYQASAEGESSLAFGKGSQALAKNAIAIGTGNIVRGENSGAIGDPSIINGANSYSVGNNNTVATNSTFVLGNEVKQTVADSVFLGDKSSSAGIHTKAKGEHYTYAGANDANVAGVSGSTAPVGVASVGTEGGQTRQIQNVAAGVVSANSTDAINGSQLYYTNEAITNVANNTINMGNQLNNRINDVADDANAGVSSAMAMASLPQAYLPGKSMITGGVASYNGEGAVAVGLSKLSDNGRWVLKISGSADTQGNAGGSIGAGFHF